jgi:hypothetical protein
MPRASFGLFKRETERGGGGYLVQWRAGLKAEQSWAPGKPWLVAGRSRGPVKPSWVHRRSRSSWSSWSVRTDARVRTEEAEDMQADTCWRMRGSERTRAGGRAGPGREWGRNTSRVCLSSLFRIPSLSRNPSLFPRDFLYTRALDWKRRKAGEVPRGSDFLPWVPSLSCVWLLTPMATASGWLASPQTPNAKGGRHTAPG